METRHRISNGDIVTHFKYGGNTNKEKEDTV